MASSGTYAWSPEIVEICDEAFERCGKDPADLKAWHMRSARRSLDYLFSEWSNEGVLLWAVDQVTVTLTDGTATYATPVGTTAILDMIIRRDDLDTPCNPMLRDEYLAIPDKTTEGLPSRYFFNRIDSLASVPVVSGATGPSITLWTTPENSTDQMIYYRLRQLEEGGVASNTPDIPFRWQEALVSGLAAKLALKFALDREEKLRLYAASQLKMAKQEDRERGPTTTRVKYGVRR
jgi:hypothetical protein